MTFQQDHNEKVMELICHAQEAIVVLQDSMKKVMEVQSTINEILPLMTERSDLIHDKTKLLNTKIDEINRATNTHIIENDNAYTGMIGRINETLMDIEGRLSTLEDAQPKEDLTPMKKVKDND